MRKKVSRHKRLIYSGLIFGISSLVIYLLFIFSLSTITVNQTPVVYRIVKGLVWKGGYTLPRYRDFDPENQYDILVFGSSTANRGINPEVFARKGLKMYNLGTDDQTPVNMEVVVRHYTQDKKPKMVILDIYDRVFCQSPYESAADIIQNGNSHSAAIKMAWNLGDVRGLNLLAVRMATRNLSPILPAPDTLYNGYRPLSNRIEDFKPDNYKYITHSKHLNAFEETICYLKKNNIKILLTVQPKPVFYMAENHENFMRDLQPIINRYDLPLFELSMKESGLEITDFADISHLNSKGANKYSEALCNKISVENLLAEY